MAQGAGCGSCAQVYETIENKSMGLVKSEHCPCRDCKSDSNACNVEELLTTKEDMSTQVRNLIR